MIKLRATVIASIAFLLGVGACGGGGGDVTPPPPQPVSISITGMPSTSMLPGQSAQLMATMTYSDFSVKNVTASATWSTTNANVLSVTSTGSIVAIAPGQADVIASSQGVSSRGSVAVATPAPQPVSLAITGVPTVSMTPGQSAQLAVTLTYSDGSTQNVSSTAMWSSTDSNVLSVSSSGAILAIAQGQADVIVSAQGLSSRATVRVALPAPRLALLTGNLGGPGSADGTGTDARFKYPIGVATDSAGIVYVGDRDNFTIRKIDPTGVVTTFAGSAGLSGSADGTGAAARFMTLWGGLATDSAGNVYVADNYTIRRITPAGIVSTWVGSPGVGGTADGSSAAARFSSSPRGLAIDRAGNVYVADTGNQTIRKISPGGVVTTLAGTAGVSGSADGAGVDARFNSPWGVAVDSAGNVYVSDSSNYTIRKVTQAGVVTTLAGSAGVSGLVDGIGTDARFGRPVGAATDSAGNVYVADGPRIRKITPAGVVSTLAGAGEYGSTDGTGPDARFGGHPFISFGGDVGFGVFGVATDLADNVYVADTGNHTIRKIAQAAVVSTIAGNALQWGRVDGVGAQARFGNCIEMVMTLFDCAGPKYVTADSNGSLFVADPNNSAIRKITPAAAVTSLVLSSPSGVATDGIGNLYVATMTTIAQITPTGVTSTLAGASGQLGSADGTGADARFYFPQGLATDGAGNVYVADTGNSTIRRITPTGVVTTLAGTAGERGSADGTGTAARFDSPTGLMTDGAGNIYVADGGNHTIRKITSAGVVTTLAGTAGQSGSADGNGAAARFNNPRGVALDSAGNLYVADAMNYTIRKITPAGAVTTVVGIAGRRGFISGALPGVLKEPYGVAIVGTSLFITMNNGVAVVTNLP